MTKPGLSIKERFLLHVRLPENPDGCWEWTGTKNNKGYGQFGINHVMCLAHRVSYALFVSEIPNNMFVCHSCDNRTCVNPEHLFLGTNQDNMDDKVRKNRQSHNTGAKGENNWSHKLTKLDVYQIREMIKQGYTQKEIAKMFEVHLATISYIKSGKIWSWLK